MEPQDRAPPQCGTTSKTGGRLVTEEHSARRGRLESRGIREKQKTIGSQEPSVTRQLEVVQPVVRGRDRNRWPLISAPSLAYRKAESEPHFLLPSLFQKGTRPTPPPVHINTQYSQYWQATQPPVSPYLGGSGGRNEKSTILPNCSTARRVGPGGRCFELRIQN